MCSIFIIALFARYLNYKMMNDYYSDSEKYGQQVINPNPSHEQFQDSEPQYWELGNERQEGVSFSIKLSGLRNFQLYHQNFVLDYLLILL